MDEASQEKPRETEGSTDSAPKIVLDPAKKRALVFAVGLLLLVAGFLVLNQANPSADNWAGMISPPMILGGFGVIIWSLLI